MTEKTKFTHIAVETRTQRQARVLASVLDRKIYEMLADLIDLEWDRAKQLGLVKDSMLKREAA